MEEETKVCTKCNQEKPLSQFYADKKAKDGHFNECKECVKKRTRERYYLNIQDESFVERERERGRRKYREKGYAHNPTSAKIQKQMKYPGLRTARRDFKVELPPTVELHHWNYTDKNHVIVLDKSLHHRLHNIIKLDIDTGYYSHNEAPLDTIDKHLNIIKSVCLRDGFDFSKVKVLSR